MIPPWVVQSRHQSSSHIQANCGLLCLLKHASSRQPYLQARASAVLIVGRVKNPRLLCGVLDYVRQILRVVLKSICPCTVSAVGPRLLWRLPDDVLAPHVAGVLPGQRVVGKAQKARQQLHVTAPARRLALTLNQLRGLAPSRIIATCVCRDVVGFDDTAAGHAGTRKASPLEVVQKAGLCRQDACDASIVGEVRSGQAVLVPGTADSGKDSSSSESTAITNSTVPRRF